MAVATKQRFNTSVPAPHANGVIDPGTLETINMRDYLGDGPELAQGLNDFGIQLIQDKPGFAHFEASSKILEIHSDVIQHVIERLSLVPLGYEPLS